MTIHKIAGYISILLCYACHSGISDQQEFVLPETPCLEKILTTGRLEISTFYNTTDYYVYRGITRGFHYDLARDFADYLGVKLSIAEVSNDVDTAICRLNHGAFDLLAASLTPTPSRQSLLQFSQPLFHTNEVLVQDKSHPLLTDLSQLNGKEIFIARSSDSYKKTLRELQDSLHIQIHLTESSQYSHEDLLHLVETGKIEYTVIDENIAQAGSLSMKNTDYSLKLNEKIPVCWATRPGNELLTAEINTWLAKIRKNGKLHALYRRYFNNPHALPGKHSKYTLIHQGDLSVFDPLLKRESRRLGWDWRLLAALVYTESQFDPEAESEVGAYGLMQIIPETADQFHVFDYFQPDSNVYVGVEYLRYLNKYFTPYPIDSLERVKFILASYNAGPGHTLDAMRLAEKYGKNPYLWDHHVDYYMLHKNEPQYYRDSLVKNGYCNGPQTYNYVQQVLETFSHYKNIRHGKCPKFKFTNID